MKKFEFTSKRWDNYTDKFPLFRIHTNVRATLFLLRCFPSNPCSSVLEQIAGGHLTKKDRPKWTTSGMDVSSITIKCINLSPIFDVHLCEIVGAGSRERAQELSLLYRWQVQAGNCPD